MNHPVRCLKGKALMHEPVRQRGGSLLLFFICWGKNSLQTSRFNFSSFADCLKFPACAAAKKTLIPPAWTLTQCSICPDDKPVKVEESVEAQANSSSVLHLLSSPVTDGGVRGRVDCRLFVFLNLSVAANRTPELRSILGREGWSRREGRLSHPSCSLDL